MDAQPANLLELSPDGTIERYFVDTESPIVLPDGSLIVEHNAQLVRLTPPARPQTVVTPLADIRSRLVDDVELFRIKSDAARYWRVVALLEFDGRTFELPSSLLDPVDDIDGVAPEGLTIRQHIQIMALSGTMVPAAADVFQAEPNADLLVSQDRARC